jgi:type III secretory pathway component EscT
VVNVVVLVAELYVVLKPVNQNLALVATFCRLVFALMWSITALNTLGALRLLGNAAYLPVFKADQLQTLARLHLTSSYDAYYVGLPFWGLASTVCSYLWFKSRYIPRGLAVFGFLASAWCVVCAFAFIVYPQFSTSVNAYWFDMPLVIFEMAVGLWLLFKGLSPSGPAGLGMAHH